MKAHCESVKQGIFISKVNPGGCADKARLQVGDKLLSVSVLETSVVQSSLDDARSVMVFNLYITLMFIVVC